MATNTNPFYTYSATAGSSKTLQKPQDGGDNNQWGLYINTDLDEIVSAVNALSDKIADANEKTLVDFTATTDAVNHVEITNAAAGSGPTLSATGDDTNIDLNIAGKGSGTAKFTSNIIIPNAGNIGSVSDPDAIAIASDGGLTFNGGIDNAGTISAGTFNGTIGSSADLSSATLPAGTILGVYHWKSGGSQDLPSATETQIINLELTRKSTSSYFIAHANIYVATEVVPATNTDDQNYGLTWKSQVNSGTQTVIPGNGELSAYSNISADPWVSSDAPFTAFGALSGSTYGQRFDTRTHTLSAKYDADGTVGDTVRMKVFAVGQGGLYIDRSHTRTNDGATSSAWMMEVQD